MKTPVRMLVLWLLVSAGVGVAQEKPAARPENPLSAWNKMAYGRVKGILLKSADKMPEENYGFKPVDTVRSYGQIIGHLADAQYMFCSVALGEKTPALDIEHTKSSKADLIAALKNGRVAAAGLDVFEGEPKLNPSYLGLKNAFLLPHIGSATVESRTLMGMVALDNIDAVLTGKPAPSLVEVLAD